MKTEYQIYMDFRLAMDQVDKLRAIANNIRTLANDDFGGTLRNIGENWTGDNAEAFLAKGDTLKGNIALTAGDLDKIATAIAQIAERTREAELAALEAARNSRKR